MSLILIPEQGGDSPKTFPDRINANYSRIEIDSASQDSNILELSGQISNNYTLLVNTSGTLQNNIESVIVTITGSIIPVINQNYSTLVSTSGILQSNINTNYSTLVSTSGILQSNINTNYSTLVSVSGTLYTNLVNTSGALQNQLTFLESISADWPRKSLDNTFTGTNNFNNNVNIYDDLFVTGTLVVSGAIDVSPSQTLISSVTDTYIVNTSGGFTNKGASISWNTNKWVNSITQGNSILLGKTITASSSYSGISPTLATDMNDITKWIGGLYNGPWWLEVDLGEGNTSSPTSFHLYVNDDRITTHTLSGKVNSGDGWTSITSSNTQINSNTHYYNTISCGEPYRYFKLDFSNGGNGGSINSWDLYTPSYVSTLNTVDTIELNTSGTAKNISPSTLILKDTSSGSNIVGIGVVNISYNKNGTGWTDLVDLETFRALSNITSCTSFKLRIQPVGAQTVGYVSISTPSSSVSLKNDGTITNSVNNTPIFTVSSDGVVVASGTIVADNCYGRAIQISNSNSPYTLDTNYTTVRIVASGGPVIINLPTAVGVEGRRYSFISTTEQNSNVITLSGGFSQTINGQSTVYLRGIWENLTIESNGSNWNTIGQKNETIRLNESSTIPNSFINSGSMFLSGGALYFQGGSGTITLLAPS